MPATPQNGREERSPDTVRAHVSPPIDDQWKDDFVESLLRELRRQLQQLQNSPPAPHAEDAAVRSANVQTIARIERTLDRLLKLQEQRALKRDQQGAACDDDARKALERKLDCLVVGRRPAKGSEEPQPE